MGFFKKIYEKNLATRAKVLYMYLYDRSNSDGECYPSISTISKDTGMSKSTIKRAMGDLVREKLLYVEKRQRENSGNTSNRYFLI